MSRPKFCAKCGNPLPPTGKFCGKCGNPIPETADAPAPQPEQAAPVPAPEQAAPIPEPVQEAPIPEEAPQPEPVPQPVPEAAQPYAAPAQPAAPEGAANTTPAMEMGKNIGAAFVKHKVPIFIGLGVCAVIVAAIIVILNLTKYQKIDAEKLFAFKYSGLNGKGTAVAYLNCQEADPDPYTYEHDEEGNVIEKEYSDYFSDEKKALLKAYDKASDKEEANEMKDALLSKTKGEYDLKVKMSKSTELSNGDKISCTVEYDEEALLDAKIKLENTEFEVEAAGLLEGQELDLFEGFDIKFTGMEERGEVEYKSQNETYPFISYYIYGSTYNLKNGDTVEVEASLSYSGLDDGFKYIDEEDSSKGIYFKYQGKTYIATATSATKSFTVSGLTEASKVDVFEKITFNTSGAAPYLRINSVNKEAVDKKISDNVSYYIDTGDKSYLKAGDTFKVKAYVSSGLLSEGLKPSETPDEDGYIYKEFTVDDKSFGYYITDKTDPGELDKFKDVFDEFTKKFQSDYAGRSYLGGVSIDGKIKSIDKLEAEKDYILIYKGFEEGTASSSNRTALYRIYKVTMTVTDKEDKDSSKTCYAAFKYVGPYVDAAGEAKLESNFLKIAVAEKLEDVVKASVDEEKDCTKHELKAGSAASKDDSSKADDSSKKDDDSSKKDESSSADEDSSSKKEDSSSKKDDSSSKKEDSSSEKDDSSSKASSRTSRTSSSSAAE